MSLSDVVKRIVGFLRAGYPEGVTTRDCIPAAVAAELISDAHVPVIGTDVSRNHQAHR